MSNILHVTDSGLAAANNASAGGLLINLTTFKIGDSSQPYADTDIDIHGNVLYQGIIHYVEVLSPTSARFTMDIPESVGSSSPNNYVDMAELGVYLPDGTLFARAVFDPLTRKVSGTAKRLIAVLHTTRCDMTIVNVTVGDYSSIPSTPFIKALPNPATSDFNAILVLDGQTNVDGTVSPIIVGKYGAGSQHWSFAGHIRKYYGNPTAGSTTSIIQFPGLDTTNFNNGEVAIVQIVAGTGFGETRRMAFNSSDGKFHELDASPFTAISDASNIAVWQSLTGLQGSGISICDYPPPLTDIPADWVLTRGSSSCPIWAPPSLGGKTLNTLYTQPSELMLASISDVGSGNVKTYNVNVPLETVNDVLVSVGSVVQHTTAYSVNGTNLEFSEDIPPSVPIEIRVVTHIPSSGTRINIHTLNTQSTGVADYVLPVIVDSADYLLVSVNGAIQHMFSYTYSVSQAGVSTLTFVEPPEAGLEIEIRALQKENVPGYSTRLLSYIYEITDTINSIELPLEPESADHVLLSVSGFRIHTNAYNVNGKTVIFNGDLPSGVELQATIVYNELAKGTPQTDLAGVVVDAVQTSKSLSLIRHNKSPVNIPLQNVNLIADSGIIIHGSFPNYRIATEQASALGNAKPSKFSTLHSLEDVEEIIFTYKVDIQWDMFIEITADFSAVIGPGFVSSEGREYIDYSIGVRTTGSREPEYGRRIKGTGVAGFSSLDSGNNTKAYSNASLTQIYDIKKSNFPTGKLDLIAKMKIQNSSVSLYGSILSINFNLKTTPVVG